MSDPHIVRHRIFHTFGLILAGEAIYALPFHVTRFFRPTALQVFDLTNTELGTAQAVYGVVAMLSYFSGGPLADRFPARKLLAWSLWSPALFLFPGRFRRPGIAGQLHPDAPTKKLSFGYDTLLNTPIRSRAP